jgi:hypothetical protein
MASNRTNNNEARIGGKVTQATKAGGNLYVKIEVEPGIEHPHVLCFKPHSGCKGIDLIREGSRIFVRGFYKNRFARPPGGERLSWTVIRPYFLSFPQNPRHIQ